MIKFFAAGVAALLSLMSVGCFAGQHVRKGDIIYECPVSGGYASGSRNYIFDGDIPVKDGMSINSFSINTGILGVRSHMPFEGRTYHYDENSRRYKVLIVDKLGNPTYTDEDYNGVIPCVNGVPPTHEEA